ncbi:MAG: DUF481 domain-containing protein [Gammaproteobacteria bacterium]|nr:DUF481 domain-containing protein [Gammaproteobacteria bacterium]
MRLSPLLKKFVLCISICGSIEAWSHAKTDLITVVNGDQITGAVNAMTAGKLSVSTSYAGTVNIKWREIKQIESRYLYEIRLDDGERIYGRFITNTIENQLTLRVSGTNRQVEIDDIVEVRSIEEELSDKLDLQLSSTITADPNNKQLVLYAAGTYDVRGGRTNFSARVDDTRSTPQGETATSSNSSFVQVSREFWRERGTAQSYRVLNARYDTNDELNIDHRGSLGVGVGRYLINDLGHELAVQAGIQGTQEWRGSCDEQVTNNVSTIALTDDEPVGEDEDSPRKSLERCADAELFFNLKWHLYSFQKRDMDIYITGNTYPSLSDWGRVRGDLNVIINWELFNNFYWTVNARTDIDNAGDREDDTYGNSDYTLSTGISWKY